MSDEVQYQVVVNHEEQYSIWPSDRQAPLGWRAAGKVGGREECLTFIREVWLDMRPLSLRKAMEGTGPATDAAPVASDGDPAADRANRR